MNIEQSQRLSNVTDKQERATERKTRKEWCDESAVSSEYFDFLIEKQCLEILSKQEALDKLKRKEIDGGNYWSITSINPVTGRLQFDNFQVKTGGDPKYRSKKGSGSDCICLPVPKGTLSIKERISQFGLVIVEGVKKAASVIQYSNYYAVSVNGVDCFALTDKKGNVRKWLKYLVTTASESNKIVRVMPDGDIKTNKNVLKGTLRAIPSFKAAKVEPKVIDSTSYDGKGVDDILASIDVDERRTKLEEILERTFDIDTLMAESTPNECGKTAEDIATFLSTKYSVDWKFDNAQKGWRHWNGKYWESKDTNLLVKAVKETGKTERIKFGSTAKIKGVCEFLALDLLIDKWSSETGRYIAFNNGIYDTETKQLVSHDKDLMLTSCLDRDYIEIEFTEQDTTISLLREFTPKTYDWMKQALKTDENVLKLMAIINGVILRRFSKFQKFICCWGLPGTGKGTFSRLLQRIVGKNNYWSSSLGKLGVDSEIASFIDKQLVICPDEDKKYGEHSAIKRLTGGDEVSYRQLYKESGHSAFHGTLIVVSNFFPFGGEKTGIERRLCSVEFTEQIKERNSAIEDELAAEIEELTTIALNMSDSEVSDHIQERINKTSVVDMRWRQELENCSVAMFMEACLVSNAGTAESWLPTSVPAIEAASSLPDDYHDKPLFTRYLELCQEYQLKPLSRPNFVKRLLDHADLIGWNIRAGQGSRALGRKPGYYGMEYIDIDFGDKSISELLSGKGEEPTDKGSGKGSGKGEEPIQDGAVKGGKGEISNLTQENQNEVAKVETEKTELHGNDPCHPCHPCQDGLKPGDLIRCTSDNKRYGKHKGHEFVVDHIEGSGIYTVVVAKTGERFSRNGVERI